MSTIKSNASLPLAVGSVVRWFAIAGLVASTTFICLSLISYVVAKGHAQSTTEVINSWNGIGGSLGQLQVPSHIPIDFKSVLSAVKLWPVGAKITKLRLEPAAPLGGDDNVATTSRHHSQEYRYENRQPFHISPQATCTFPDRVRSAYEQGRLEEIVSMRPE